MKYKAHSGGGGWFGAGYDRASKIFSHYGAVLVVTGGLVLFSPMASAELDVTPNLGLGITYSDNVTLSPQGQEQDDVVGEITPGIDLIYEGPNADADLRYRAQTYFYQNNEDYDQTYHHLLASGGVNLIGEMLDIDAGAAIRQQVIDPSVSIPPSNIEGAGNLTDQKSAYISPVWQSRIGGRADFSIRYAAGLVNYDEDTFNNSVQQGVAALLENVPESSWISWAVRFKQSNVDFEDGQKVEFKRTALELGIPVTSRIRFVALGGAEENSFDQAEGSDPPEGGFWAVGFRSQRSQRYEFEVLAGERFFGNTYRLRWLQTANRWTVQAEYDEDFVTFSQSALDIDPTAVEHVLPGPDFGRESAEVYLRERVQLVFNTTRSRNLWTLRLFDESRDYQESGDTEKLKGADAQWSWLFMPRTRLLVSGGYQENQLRGTTTTDELTRAGFGFERQLSRRIAGTLMFRYSTQESDFSEREYIARSVGARLVASF